MRLPFSPSALIPGLPNYRSSHYIRRHLALIIAILTGLMCGTAAHASTASFNIKQDFATGTNPRAVAVSDLNGDGKLDLVTANLNTNSVSVLLNTTTPGAAIPTFAPKKDFPTSREPVSVVTIDANGDGKPDLAVGNFASNNISILLNTTVPGALTPTFAGKQDFATSEGPLNVAVGDLNSDGKLDLVAVAVLSDTISVLLNTTAPGSATTNFAAHQEFATELGPTNVQLGDLNGDGKLDVAVANFNSGTVSLLVNTTDPGATHASFSGIQEFDVGDGPASLSIGDVNRDGKLDLVVAISELSTVSVHLNTTVIGATTLSFSHDQQFSTATALAPVSIIVADLNGDSRLDLATANRNSDDVSVLLNASAPGDAIASFEDKQDFTTDDAPVFIQAGDVNNDGRLDLVVANINSNSVSVLLNTSDQGTATPGFAVKQDVETSLNPRSVAVGDLNGDGRDDLVVANVGSDSVSVELNSSAPGAATASFSPKKDFPTGTDPVAVTMSDLNMDGKLDLVVVNINSNSVSVLVNTTVPGAVTPNFVRQDFATGTAPLFVSAGDLNGDGKPDLVVADTIVAVSVLFNTTVPGALIPTFSTNVNVPVGDGPRSVALADINGDGKLDLAVVDFNIDNISVLLNTTTPGAATPTFSEIAFFPTAVRPASIVSADLNNDGKPDLAVVNINSNNVSVLLNTTAPGTTIPTFAAKQDFDTGPNSRSVLAEDLNGDGKLDLAIVKSFANAVAVLVNTTQPGAAVPSFAPKQDVAAGNNSIFVASGDLNVDGKPDLVTANFDANTVSVLLNTVTIVTATGLSVQQASPATNLQIANVTDYGGNGNVGLKVIADDPANGVTISNVKNSDGKITADVEASCSATTATFTLLTTDGISAVTDTLKINVTANSAPTLTYQNQTVALNGALNINPANAPLDNGSVSSIVVQSAGTFTGGINVDGPTGVISITNAAPVGTHTIVIRATDNCGATTDAGFTLTVAKADQTISFGALANKTLGDPDFAVSATASSGLPVSFAADGHCAVSGNIVHIISVGSCTITASQSGNNNFNPAPDVAQNFTITNSTIGTVITLNQANYNVNENTGVATITVNRTGDLSAPASVEYATADTGSSEDCSALNTGGASSRCDFGLTLGTLSFAATESQKTFIIPLTQDSYTEGPETFTVNLSKLIGASFGDHSSATVTISDGTIPLPPNANDNTETFVRQQYRDFLNRDADPSGLAFWTGEINNCTPKPQCTDVKRINVSAAFFLSIEFQTTGNLVRSLYVAALDRPATNNMPAFDEFERDTQAMQRGVIVDSTNAFEIVLANNRDALLKDFVMRAEFTALYPTTDTPTQYVDKLFLHADITPTADERGAAIAQFGNAPAAADAAARGRALLRVAQNTTFQQREFNRSFVQMQFLGYLRRNPNDAPDRNFAGFDFWLTKLNQFNGNFQDAEMVKAFISSSEYRKRFGP